MNQPGPWAVRALFVNFVGFTALCLLTNTNLVVIGLVIVMVLVNYRDGRTRS